MFSELFARWGLSLMYTTNSGFYIQSELLGVANITTDDGESFSDASFLNYIIGIGMLKLYSWRLVSSRFFLRVNRYVFKPKNIE